LKSRRPCSAERTPPRPPCRSESPADRAVCQAD
jgi:hypothetical protein